MMIFNGILKTADMGRVLEILKTHYDSSDNDIESYRQLFGSLLNMEAKPSKCRISITHVTDDYDGEEYDTVYGIVPGEKMHYSLELTRRDEWLGMELEEDTLKNYTADEIAAHCLWEMTFLGFTEEEIQGVRDKLEDSRKKWMNGECREYYEFVDGEFVRKERQDSKGI